MSSFQPTTTATASTATSSITREMVLTVAAVARDEPGAEYHDRDAATLAALHDIVKRAAAVKTGEEIVHADVVPTAANEHAVGAVVFGVIFQPNDQSYRFCLVAALAVLQPGYALTGRSSLKVPSPSDPGDGPVGPSNVTTTLAGEVTTSTMTFTGHYSDHDVTFSASGSATKSVSTGKKVTDTKSAAEKRAAKATYRKRLKAAKAAYAKALAAAGSSTRKKRAAKKAYSKKKASAKTKYKKAISPVTRVKETTRTIDERPFSISASRANA